MIGTGAFELQFVKITNVAGELRNGSCCDGKHARSYGSLRCLDPCDTFVKLCVKQYGATHTAIGPCRFGSMSTPVLGENSFDIPVVTNKTMKDGKKFSNPIVMPFTFSWMVSTNYRPFSALFLFPNNGRNISLILKYYELRFLL